MYKRLKDVLLALMLAAILPSLLMLCVPARQLEVPEAVTAPTQGEAAPETKSLSVPVLMDSEEVIQMDMNSYLLGVVLCEMPAEFEIEALKAQAVVARTYALRRHNTGNKHRENAVCTDAVCCQGYISSEIYLKNGGSSQDVEKVRQAVLGTADQVLLYKGALIEATYFSCSGGKTEDAQAVWGSQVPYLQSVSSPGEEKAAHYTDTITFSAQQFQDKLSAVFSGAAGTWVGPATYTVGGGVDTIEIGGNSYSGITLRQKLGLRSTAFVITAVGDTVTVTTKGYGHRVGMSQYGAEAMAVAGSTYDQILTHYYQDIELVQYAPD